MSKFKILLLFTTLSYSSFAFYSSNQMSLEEKIGQLLMVHFHGENVNDDAKTLIQDCKVGSIIYYNWSNGLHSPEQIQTLSKGLQKLTEKNRNSIPLLIAADQEGGLVSRLNRGFTEFPGNRALGETLNPNFAKDTSLAMGEELKAVGINMNLAPVVDVNCNPQNPVIGIRSFGEDVDTVVAFGEMALTGFRQAQVIATLKHFPGYGDVAVDPHEDLPIINKTLDELKKVELLPFAKLASSADAIMTAHILVPALDRENCSTLSAKTLTYLREAIGFNGVIIADSLVMNGVIKKCKTVDEAAIQALIAGCDILILGGKLLNGELGGYELSIADVKRIHSSLVHAVKSGRILEARVNQAVEKILHLKNHYLIHENLNTQTDLTHLIYTTPHRALAQEVARLALKSTSTELKLPSLNNKNIAYFAPQLIQKEVEQSSLYKLGKTAEPFFYNLNPSLEEIELAKQCAQKADILIICSYNAWKSPSQIVLIQSLIELGNETILLVTRDPLDASLFPNAKHTFKTFSPSSLSFQAVFDQLNKRSLR